MKFHFKLRRLLVYLIIMTALLGCEGPKIIYEIVAVDQENAYRFTKITLDDEDVVHPSVTPDPQNAKRLIYNTANLLGISPDGQSLAYSDLKDSKFNIFIKNLNGGKATVQRTFRDHVTEPCYSPDNQYLAFIDQRGPVANVCQMKASEGMALTQISSANAVEYGPGYSKQRNELFFVRREGANVIERTTQKSKKGTATINNYYERFYIWSYSFDKGQFTQFCEGFNPSFDTSGSKMAITRNSSTTGNGEIWLVDIVTGLESRILSDNDMGFSNPQISPDGKHVLCVGVSKRTSTSPVNLDLYLINIDGTGFTQLTFHPGNDCCPRWAPNGKEIYFLSQRGNKNGKYNIWKMNYNG